MKTVNTILRNPDILCRFRLLQLWCVDMFSKSIKDDEPTLNRLINATMLNTDDINDSPESMLNTLIELKKEYEEYNKKLEKISKIISLQNKYAKVLKDIDDSIDVGTNNVDDVITKNNRLIDGINNLNLNSFKDV